jgi:hypothetical protein
VFVLSCNFLKKKNVWIKTISRACNYKNPDTFAYFVHRPLTDDKKLTMGFFYKAFGMPIPADLIERYDIKENEV